MEETGKSDIRDPKAQEDCLPPDGMIGLEAHGLNLPNRDSAKRVRFGKETPRCDCARAYKINRSSETRNRSILLPNA